MSVLNHKVLLAAGVGTLTAVLLGGAALATFAPIAYDSPSQIDSEVGTAAPANSGNDKLKSILDGLIGKGLITQAQEDAILAALKAATPVRDAATVRKILGGLFDESAKYLGLTPADLKTKVAGTNLGALADATTGKNTAGLTATLQNAVNAAIDKALAETKITADQAAKAKADAPAQIAKFVQQNYPQPRAPKTTTRVMKVTEFIGDIYVAARDYLGLPQADLLKAVREGKSLGEIAPTIAGKNKVDLVSAIAAVANTKIDKAVTDGKLTADQATALKAQVGPAVTALVDRKLSTAIGKRPTLDRKP